MSEEINELQREWRAIVLEKLSGLETGQHELRKEIAEVKNSFAARSDLESLRVIQETRLQHLQTKIDEFEKFKQRVYGGGIILQILWGIAIAIVSYL